MFSYEERLKAVKLYLKYNRWIAVINELGYPNRDYLRRWIKEKNINIKSSCKKKKNLYTYRI